MEKWYFGLSTLWLLLGFFIIDRKKTDAVGNIIGFVFLLLAVFGLVMFLKSVGWI